VTEGRVHRENSATPSALMTDPSPACVLLVLQVGFVHLPVMQALFRTADLTATDWLLAAAAGAVVIPVMSAEWAWRRSRRGPEARPHR
jgi:cation transport ATPase-like protein